MWSQESRNAKSRCAKSGNAKSRCAKSESAKSRCAKSNSAEAKGELHSHDQMKHHEQKKVQGSPRKPGKGAGKMTKTKNSAWHGSTIKALFGSRTSSTRKEKSEGREEKSEDEEDICQNQMKLV